MFAALDEIEPKAKGNDGAWSLPNGAAYYDARLAQNTTTDLTADQIHRIGLQQVAAIRGEMERVKARIGHKGSLETFFDAVRTNPEFKFPNTAAGPRAISGAGARGDRADDGRRAALVPQPAQGAARGARGREMARGHRLGRLLQPPHARRVAARASITSTSPT